MLKALHKLVNLLCSGSAPSCIMTHLCGASLLASIKKDGGLRPIAVREVLRRLTAKGLARASNRKANCILAPLQVGVGVPRGTEAAVHALRNTQENVSIQDSDKWVLLLDFANPFNSIDREIMLSEVQSRLPGLSAWFQFCYSNPSSFLFGILCGSGDDLLKALDIVEEMGPSRGLQLNRHKSLLYIPPTDRSTTNPLPSDIPVAHDGFVLLGSRIVSPSFCDLHVQKQVEKLSHTLSFLSDLRDSKMETTILRSCLGFPKISFLIRTCPLLLLKMLCHHLTLLSANTWMTL